MGRSGWTAWSLDAAAAGAAFTVLVLLGTRPLGSSALGSAATVSLVCTWAMVASAVVAVIVAVGGRRPPRMTGAGVVALALVAPSLASVGTNTGVRIVAVAAGAAVPIAVAGFAGAVVAARSHLGVRALAVSTVIAVTARLLVRDPFRELRCAPYCGTNPLLVVARPDWVLTADRLLAVVAMIWCVATVVVIARARLTHWSRESAALAVTAVALSSVISLARPGLTIWSDPTARVVALVPLVLLLALILAMHPDLQVWRTRTQVRHLAFDLSESARRGSVAQHLRELLHDPSIRLLFPLGSDGLLDDDGRTAERDDQLVVTTVERDGETIAVIEHEPRSSGRLRAALTPAATVAVENEWLRARARSELAELRTSRRRIVERADETRRRLERDLHDGAQQRLLLLGMELARAADAADPCERERYLAAISHTQGALAELRNLVHEGLPPLLDELGLVEALRSLAETTRIPVLLELDTSVDQRPPLIVERVIYGLARSMIANGEALGASKVTISLAERSGQVTATITYDAATVLDPTDDEDRIGAAGGNLTVTTGEEGVAYVASFP